MTSDLPESRGAGTTEVAARRHVRNAAAPPFIPTGPIPAWLPAALVLAALPMLRPNILGERGLSIVGFGLMTAAALLALLARRGQVREPGTGVQPGSVLIACLGAGYLFVLLREAATRPGLEATATIQGIVLTVGSLLALQIVCRDPRSRRWVGRGFVIMLVVLSSSYAVTALLWAATGVGSGQISTFPVGSWGPSPLYFPFTTTASFQPVFGVTIPRFTGLGREPGWMAMYCAAGFFLAGSLGMRSRLVRGLLLVGLLGCVSTAGFGVFVVTWAYHRFLRARGGITIGNYMRQVGGLLAMGFALWLAVAAPVVGLSAKSRQNAESLDERSSATDAGIRYLFSDPWGGHYNIVQGGINLISDIAVSGLPFVVLVCAGLLLTMNRSATAQAGNAVALVVFLTLLTSQPPKDSTWAFGIVVLACSLRRPDDAPAPLDAPHPVRTPTKERMR